MNENSEKSSFLLAAIGESEWSVSAFRRGQRLWHARIAKDMSTPEAARRLGVSQDAVLAIEAGYEPKATDLTAQYAATLSVPDEILEETKPRFQDYFGGAEPAQALQSLREELSASADTLSVDPLRTGDLCYLMAELRLAEGEPEEAAGFLRIARHYYAEVAPELADLCDLESISLVIGEEAPRKADSPTVRAQAAEPAQSAMTIFSRALGAIADLLSQPLQPVSVKGTGDQSDGQRIDLYTDRHAPIEGVSTVEFSYTLSIEQTTAEGQTLYLLSCRLGTGSGPLAGVRVRVIRSNSIIAEGITGAAGEVKLPFDGPTLDPNMMSETEKLERLEVQILSP